MTTHADHWQTIIALLQAERDAIAEYHYDLHGDAALIARLAPIDAALQFARQQQGQELYEVLGGGRLLLTKKD